MRVAANLSFMFKDRPFLERFQAAASCGQYNIGIWELVSLIITGFKGVECGPELYSYNLQELITTKQENKLEIVLINSPRGTVSLFLSRCTVIT